MSSNDTKDILKRYRNGECTPQEIALVESWYLNFEEEDNDITLGELDDAKNKIWASLPVHETIKTKQIKFWNGYTRLAAAAVIVLSVAVGLFLSRDANKKEEIAALDNSPIIPGGKKAFLTLANGKSIVLSDAQNGKLADQTGTSIFKTENGEIVYNNENGKPSKVEYNQLSIPRGGYYVLTLADGTKVWLNSESSLRYPTAFDSNERMVELVGEGYFEVAHRKNQPFKVVTSKQTVEVLGTHFNVNAYDNEKATTTTLLEGSVQIASSRTSNDVARRDLATTILKPGEQAILKNDKLAVMQVDAEEAVAWVNNNFNFNNEALGSIMRKISRWYDVDVVCPPELEKREFIGTVSRAKNIKDVIKIMEKTDDIHFKVEGRRITVMH